MVPYPSVHIVLVEDRFSRFHIDLFKNGSHFSQDLFRRFSKDDHSWTNLPAESSGQESVDLAEYP